MVEFFLICQMTNQHNYNDSDKQTRKVDLKGQINMTC